MPWDDDDFMGLLRILALDLMETYEHLQLDQHHQPARRTWVRTFCSQVEAVAFGTKQLLAEFSVLPYVQITPHELILLREEEVDVDDKGNVNVHPKKFLSPKKNLLFLAGIVTRGLGADFRLDKADHGWEALNKTFAIRNRLVHPKRAADLVVTDEELGVVSTAQDWFQKMHLDLARAIETTLRTKGPQRGAP